jgi:hypothetical protein
MRGEEVREDIGDRLSVKAVVAGLAALYAAALAVGVLDGAPPQQQGRPRVQVASCCGVAQAAAGGRDAAAPVWGLCFRGPRGEPVDFATVQNCPRAGAPQ